ncbi:MAG: hypothetical protein KAS04_01800 [Candidatus Aenigmarchaeota archaeon]|nr:hypothetical protein [Candidatus Aenigmarchaeota archaeon]
MIFTKIFNMKASLGICVFIIIFLSLLFQGSDSMYRSSLEEWNRQKIFVAQRDATIEKQESAISTQNEIIGKYEKTIGKLNHSLTQREINIDWLESDLSELKSEVDILTINLDQTTGELDSTKDNLDKTTGELLQTEEELEETERLLEIAKLYEKRVKQGIDRSLAYELLNDYDETRNLIVGITSVQEPRNDAEMWERVKDIYDWLGEYYMYCFDKGICLGNYCVQMQYFSPDELLFGSQYNLCGDCDDYAQLFVGMMYASGVPHDKARVECGLVPGGGHCWAGVKISSGWYRIDPVCSDPAKYANYFDQEILVSGEEFPSEYQDVDCMQSYQMLSWYDVDGYHEV